MICLSKADEASLRHKAFNQSPRALSPESTTRQDLNGISNLREHVAADQDDGSGGGAFASSDTDEKWNLQNVSPNPPPGPLAGARRWFNEPSSPPMAASGGEDQRWPPDQAPSSKAPSRLRDWVTWTASVLLVSLILTTFATASIRRWGGRLVSFPDQTSQEAMPLNNGITHVAMSQEAPVRTPANSLPKRDSCASGGASKSEYDMPLHVGALIIIWFVSTLGSSFALLAQKFPVLKIPPRFFFVVRHFGTGVLIATAFVHLLPTAFISLGDPCLGDFWTKDYNAMPGAIALAAIFFVTIIEMVFHPSRQAAKCSSAIREHAGTGMTAGGAANGSDERTGKDSGQRPVIRDMAPPHARSQSVSHSLNRLPSVNGTSVERTATAQREKRTDSDGDEESSTMARPPVPTPEQKRRKDRLQVVLLELGILFHSVFIGMALSVSVGTDFIILLVAIIFHQSFEGLALGSRISLVQWDTNYQPWVMAAAYGCTTPLGQALGIATHTLYSPDSRVGLIVVGVMNSISAGLLTFASLVELLSEDFLSDESWTYLRGAKRVVGFSLVFAGSFCMSLVGAWA